MNEKPCSKVLLRLVTGRRHQLRVHLNFIGHQIVGDTSYGLDDYDTYRTMLHAYAFSMKIKDKTIKAIDEDPFRNDIVFYAFQFCKLLVFNIILIF